VDQRKMGRNQGFINVFPNPSSNHFFINFKIPQTGRVSLRLYDMQGKLVKTIYEGLIEKERLKKLEMKTEMLQAGVYITRLQTAEGVSEKKLIITK